MASEFNPIAYSSELESAGVPKEQATAHAKALVNVLADVAFSRDLVKLESNLRKEIRECEERLSLRIDMVRADLIARIDALRTVLDARIDILEARLTQVEAGIRAEMMALRAEMTELRAEMTVLRADIGSVRTELVLHRWVLGLVLALGTANLALTIRLILP